MKAKRNLVRLLLVAGALCLGALLVNEGAKAVGIVTRNQGTAIWDGLGAKYWVETYSGKSLPTRATFTVGTKAGNDIDTQIAFLNGAGSAIAYPYQTYCWGSPASTGAGYVVTAGTAVFSAVTNGSVESVTSGKSANAITSATGTLGVRWTQTSTTVAPAYLCCRGALGVTLCSGVVQF